RTRARLPQVSGEGGLMVSKRGKLALTAVVIVLVLLAGYFMGFLSLSTVGLGVDTSTKTYDYYAVYGAGATGNRLPGELLDQDTYVASWDPTLLGQRASVAGALKIVPSECGFDCSGGVKITGQRTDYVLTL